MADQFGETASSTISNELGTQLASIQDVKVDIETRLDAYKGVLSNMSVGGFNASDVVFDRDIIPRGGIFVGTGRAEGNEFDDFPVTILGTTTVGGRNIGEIYTDRLQSGEIDSGAITITGAIKATGQQLTCGAITCGELDASSNTLTCGTVNCGEIAAGTNALTCGKVNCGEIAAGGSALTCGAVTCGTIDADSSTLTCGGIVVKKVVDIPADLDQWTVSAFGATATNSNSGPDASLAILVSSGDAFLELDMNTDIGSHGAGRFVLTFQLKLPSTAVAGGSLDVRLPGVATTAIGSSTDITPFIDQWAEVTCDIDVSAGIDSKLFFSFTDFPAEVSEIRLRYPVSVTIGRPISDIGIIIDSDLETKDLKCGAITTPSITTTEDTLLIGTDAAPKDLKCGALTASGVTTPTVTTTGDIVTIGTTEAPKGLKCGAITATGKQVACGSVAATGEIKGGTLKADSGITVTSGAITCGAINAGTSTLACGPINATGIVNVGTETSRAALNCGDLDCGQITCNNIVSDDTIETKGSFLADLDVIAKRDVVIFLKDSTTVVTAAISNDGELSCETIDTKGIVNVGTATSRAALNCGDLGCGPITCGAINTTGVVNVGAEGSRAALTCGAIGATTLKTTGAVEVGSSASRAALTCGAIGATTLKTTGAVEVGSSASRAALKCGAITATGDITALGDLNVTNQAVIGTTGLTTVPDINATSLYVRSTDTTSHKTQTIHGDGVGVDYAGIQYSVANSVEIDPGQYQKAWYGVTGDGSGYGRCKFVWALNKDSNGDNADPGDTTQEMLTLNKDGLLDLNGVLQCGAITATGKITATNQEVACGTINTTGAVNVGGKVVISSADKAHGVYIGSNNTKRNSSSGAQQVDMYVPLTLTANADTNTALMIRTNTDYGKDLGDGVQVGGISWSLPNGNSDIFSPQASINCIFGPDSFNGTDSKLVFKLGDADVSANPIEVVQFGQKGDIECRNIDCAAVTATGNITATGKTITCGPITATGKITATNQEVACGTINTTGAVIVGAEGSRADLTCGAITATGLQVATINGYTPTGGKYQLLAECAAVTWANSPDLIDLDGQVTGKQDKSLFTDGIAALGDRSLTIETGASYHTRMSGTLSVPGQNSGSQIPIIFRLFLDKYTLLSEWEYNLEPTNGVTVSWEIEADIIIRDNTLDDFGQPTANKGVYTSVVYSYISTPVEADAYRGNTKSSDTSVPFSVDLPLNVTVQYLGTQAHDASIVLESCTITRTY
jgi:hypothetical protein